MICSYECTYCEACALNIFENVSPSCSGNFAKRPIRPQNEIKNNPASEKRIFRPKNLEKAKLNSNTFKTIPPEKR